MHRQALLAALTSGLAGLARGAPAETSSYDYIVIGSGPGGGPLACDLARANYTVLLIEAGSDMGDNEVYTNMANFNTAGNDEHSRWDFWVKHSTNETREREFEHYVYRVKEGEHGGEEFYVGLNPPPGAKPLGIQYPRAATLGGCAMHNGGVCSLAQDEDWEIIVKSTGDESWKADKMRKYLIEVEKNEYLPSGTKGHGFNGYLEITATDASWGLDPMQPSSKVMAAVAKMLNASSPQVSTPQALVSYANTDILGDYPSRDTQSSLYAMAQHANTQGKRSSPNGYIRATVKAGFPLTIMTETLATRVLFDPASLSKTPTATGVEVMKGKSLYRADPRYVPGTKGAMANYTAKREVIVAGGAFNSPQILKLSGVGPAAELAKFKIPVVVDLPGVGVNLADNYEGGVLATSNSPVGGGLITAIFRTPETAPDARRNIFTWCGAFSFEGFWPGFPEYYGETEYECAMVHMNPKSQKGTVLLTSADPQDVPDINFGFFSEIDGDGGKAARQDLAELAEASDMLRKTWQAATPAKAGDPSVLPFNEMHPCPGTSAGAACTRQSQMEILKTQAYSHHATSTCAIGGPADKLAVLDSKFNVRGTKGLRVVDASAFPRVPGAFPVLPTMMLSKKAAETILMDVKATDGHSHVH